ncbi:hypothetical protein [Winogradskyella sp. 3972H.M.0a.05]|uniref:hypothetical protein n=1 Tax=Winogradskyella sp. 3972H.M.0a.05 TaxID=2950277 RepID=UPI0033911B89
MKQEILVVVLILVLIITLYQDVKQRSIHILLPVASLLCCLGINFSSTDLEFKDFFQNLLFIAVNIFGLILYYSIKNKTFVNPIDSMIGLGDFLFLVSVAPLFKLKSFILFFIAGLIFSLVLHLLINIKIKSKTVPLAGYLSVFLIVDIILSKVSNYSIVNI